MIQIKRADFSADEIIKKLKKTGAGCIATYTGIVRRTLKAGKRVKGLKITGGAGLKRQLEDMRKRTVDKFNILDAVIVHRLGFLGAGKNILFAAVSSSHRGPAFQALEFLINAIKNEIHRKYKKEIY